MALLRKITKAKWYDQPWLPQGQIQADALVDLRTQNNELSVWRIEPDESNLNAIVAALASSKTSRIDKLDYVLLDDAALERLDITYVKSQGDSPHTDANVRWHCDLVGLTVAKVVELAREVKRCEPAHKRLPHTAVRAILKSALDGGMLERKVVEEALVSELEG